MKIHYPNLEEFLGTYFHQDWREDSATATGVVERYVAEWPSDEIRSAAKELQHLLTETPTEDRLADATRQLGSYYNPEADGLSYRDWLQKVYQLLL
jgi:CdiI immunity protein